MKLIILVLMLVAAPFAFSGQDTVLEILDSKAQNCPQAQALYKTLRDRNVYDVTRIYLTVFKVTGMMDNGQEVLLILTRRYICDYGSFGGGGCKGQYSCDIEFN